MAISNVNISPTGQHQACRTPLPTGRQGQFRCRYPSLWHCCASSTAPRTLLIPVNPPPESDRRPQRRRDADEHALDQDVGCWRALMFGAGVPHADVPAGCKPSGQQWPRHGCHYPQGCTFLADPRPHHDPLHIQDRKRNKSGCTAFFVQAAVAPPSLPKSGCTAGPRVYVLIRVLSRPGTAFSCPSSVALRRVLCQAARSLRKNMRPYRTLHRRETAMLQVRGLAGVSAGKFGFAGSSRIGADRWDV